MCHVSRNAEPAQWTRPSRIPQSPQLWQKNEHGGIGVAGDPPGKIFWEVENGIRLTGMPAFHQALNERQEWQVSLLVQGAGQPLPADAIRILNSGLGTQAVGMPQSVAGHSLRTGRTLVQRTFPM